VPARDFELTEPQSRAYQLLKPKTDINLEFGRGCGKSWFDRFVAWILVAQYDYKDRTEVLRELGWELKLKPGKGSGDRGVRVVFLMPTLKQFKAVHGGGLRAEIADWGFLKPEPNWSDWRINFPGGSWLQPFPAEAHSSERARGLRCDVVICDEADDIDPGVFDSIVRPWFSEPWSLKIRLTSGTYKRGRHGLLWRRRVAGRDPNEPRYHTIHATYRDNPEIVDKDEVEDARRHTAPAVFAREWECDPDSAEGLVYPFDEDFHVREPPDNAVFSEVLIGCDHGWEDPGVFLVIGVVGSGRDAVAYVIDEIYEQHRTEDWWKAELKRLIQKYPRHKFYADPSQPARIETFKRDCKARNQDWWEEFGRAIEDGIGTVANMLAIRERTVSVDEDKTESFSRLYVSAKCKNTLVEFGKYRRKQDPKNKDVFLDEVEDRNNHAMDALRYALFGRFGWPKVSYANKPQPAAGGAIF
jgi:hypothetical protein